MIFDNNIQFQNITIKIMIVWCLFIFSCSEDENLESSDPTINILYLPVVVHIVHHGEIVGEGSNLSEARIERQIEILNEDFRRKTGTRGFNDHPDSEDSRIEFVLAKKDPSGNPSKGINRINQNMTDAPDLGYNQNHYAQYAYWDPNRYINIWTTPLPEASECLVLGASTGPDTDLPGTEYLQIPQIGDAEGILINWMHFGESSSDCQARFGRTLTHEMGHFLGLLHTWGNRDCENNDFCDDTPAVDEPVYNSAIGCDGETVNVSNYMNWSDDALMNTFTKDQIARMHYVLGHHDGRHNLLTSPALYP